MAFVFFQLRAMYNRITIAARLPVVESRQLLHGDNLTIVPDFSSLRKGQTCDTAVLSAELRLLK